MEKNTFAAGNKVQDNVTKTWEGGVILENWANHEVLPQCIIPNILLLMYKRSYIIEILNNKVKRSNDIFIKRSNVESQSN